jgi:predicted NBD/HSP70 family sugar kinase
MRFWAGGSDSELCYGEAAPAPYRSGGEGSQRYPQGSVDPGALVWAVGAVMNAAGSRRLRLSVPAVSARVSPESVASTLARMIASREAVTRADLVRATGLARSTVAAGLEVLHEAGVICQFGMHTTTGRGRPAEDLGLSSSFGLVLVADLGVRFARLSVHALSEQMLTASEMPLDVADGPEPALATVTEVFKALLARIEHPRPMPLVMVIGLPGPVDAGRGVAVKPPIMPGWDDFPVADTLQAAFGCPVLCENDVNLRALGEARAIAPDQSPLLYVKISTGIGGGLVTGSGELYHGADGSAGDIGHVRVHGADDVLCICGNYGCVEAVASAPAILRQLSQAVPSQDDVPATGEELMAALRVNEKTTVRLVRAAASQVGEVVANLVHFFNPARIVVGGGLTIPSDDMLAGIRAVVYQRALPLATRNLVIGYPTLGEWSGTSGGLVLGIEHALTPDALLAAMAARRHRPRR